MEGISTWKCQGSVGSGWEAKQALDLDFFVDCADSEGGSHSRICIFSSELRFEQLQAGQAMMLTLNDKPRMQKFTLHALVIKSNAKFVELYTSQSSDTEDFQYISTIKCYTEADTDPNSFELSGDISELLVPCRRMRLKFMSLKGNVKCLKIDGIAISSTGLRFDDHKPSQSSSSNASSIIAANLNPLEHLAPTESAIAASVPPQLLEQFSSQLNVIDTDKANRSLASVPAASVSKESVPAANQPLGNVFTSFNTPGILDQLLAFRADFLADIGVMIDVKLNPVLVRLNKIEGDVKSIRDAINRVEKAQSPQSST